MRTRALWLAAVVVTLVVFYLGLRIDLLTPTGAQTQEVPASPATEMNVKDLPPPDMGLPPGMEMPSNVENPTLPPEVEQGLPTTTLPGQPTDLSIQPEWSGGYNYDPTGRRDPFVPPVSMMQAVQKEEGVVDQGPVVEESPLGSDPLLSYYLKDYRVLAIVWDISDPKAMISAPNSRVYTIRRKMRLGREGAVVVAIREREVVLVEPDESGSFEKGIAKILRLRN